MRLSAAKAVVLTMRHTESRGNASHAIGTLHGPGLQASLNYPGTGHIRRGSAREARVPMGSLPMHASSASRRPRWLPATGDLEPTSHGT
jgi:hypothetical protein